MSERGEGRTIEEWMKQITHWLCYLLLGYCMLGPLGFLWGLLTAFWHPWLNTR